MFYLVEKVEASVSLINQRNQKSQSNFRLVSNYLLLPSDQTEVTSSRTAQLISSWLWRIIFVVSSSSLKNPDMTFDLDLTSNAHIKGLQESPRPD